MTILYTLAKKWVAGKDKKDAIKKVGIINSADMKGIINFLGEHCRLSKEVRLSRNEYISLLRCIHRQEIESSISVKLTQLGLMIDESLCYENVSKITREAKKLNLFVWIDMESSEYTEKTLDIYQSLLKNFDNVGVAIQAYLKRSEKDVMDLIKNNGKIRLCKGGYREVKSVFKSKKEIDLNFIRIMRLMFKHGNKFAIATHDDKIIREAIDLAGTYPKDFEFQMLMGVRDKLKLKLVKKRYNLSVYIPYGKDYLPYFLRRLKERKSNILLMIRSLFD